MSISPELRGNLVERLSAQAPSIDQPTLERIIDEVSTTVGSQTPAPATPPPFDVPWMDSYLAHWTLGQSVLPAQDRFDEVAQVVRDAMDANFEERKADLLRWISGGLEPPDGGPPEPGAPPVGPEVFEPPDGGPPEPGTPPVGPEVFDPPDGGPPEPGVPPVGPDASFLGDNPWILYWFMSVKAPMLLDVIDAHLTRRLEELGFQQ